MSFCVTPDHPSRVSWIQRSVSIGRRYIRAAKVPRKSAHSGPTILIHAWRRTGGAIRSPRISASVRACAAVGLSVSVGIYLPDFTLVGFTETGTADLSSV